MILLNIWLKKFLIFIITNTHPSLLFTDDDDDEDEDDDDDDDDGYREKR